MDSSQYNPNYAQWNPPYSSSHPPPSSSQSPLLPPPPPFPPPPRQSHPKSPNIYPRSIQNGNHHHQEYHHHHHYSQHRQDLPPKPAVNQPSPSYYSQHPPQQQQQRPSSLSQQQQQHPQYVPQQVSYESQRLLQSSSSGLESQRVDFKDMFESWSPDSDTGRGRVDAAPSRSYQYDYSRSSRDSSGIDVNGSSRSRDEFRSLGYVRTESGATRIEGNYQDRGQLKSDSERYYRGLDERKRGLSSRVGYASERERYGATESRGRDMSRSSASHEGIRNQRRDAGHNEGRTLYPRNNDDYYHTDIEQYVDRGRREESNESNRTPRKQVQKKSALLRLEAPRSHQNGRENDRSWQPSQYSGKRFKSNSFRGKEHLGQSDRGLVEKQRRRTSVDLDVSFESNVLVAKLSPTSADTHPGSSVAPRSSKARRALMTDKNEKAPVSEGNGKFRTHFSDGAFVSEGSRRPTTASEIEKKPGNYSNPSFNDSEGKLSRVSFVDGVVQDCKGKITDTGSEASTHDSEAKVRGTVHAAEKISSFSEVLKEAKDDTNVKHDSKMEAACTEEVCGTVHAAEKISSFCNVLKEAKDNTNVKDDSNMEAACSTEEDVIDGEKTTLKSDEDVLNRQGTDCNAGEAILLKVTEKEEIMKTKTNVNTSPIKLPLSGPTAADLSGCSEAGIHSAAMSICSVGSQPFEDEDMDWTPTRDLPVMEISTGFEERKSTESSMESLGYGIRDYEKSSLEASINFNNEDHVDQVLVKSDSGVIEDDNKEISKNVDSLTPENDSSRDPPSGVVSSAALDVTSVSMELSNANNSVSGGFANANNSVSGDLASAKYASGDLSNSNSSTIGIYANTMVKAPDMRIAFQVERQNLPHCERDTANSSVENVNRKESLETTPLSSAAEMADNLDKDECKQTCVDGISSSCTKVAVNGSSRGLPVESSEGCSRNDESDLAMAVPSEVYMENVTTEKLNPDQDLVLASHHPAEIPYSKEFSGSDRRGVKASLLEPNVSFSKDIHDGSSECLVERDVSQIASRICDNLPSSIASVIETNLATGINGMAGSQMIVGAESGLHETPPCLIVCKFLPEDRIGCESSGAIASVWDPSLDKDLVKDPSRVSSCVVSNSSITPCHMSPLVAVTEQIQNKVSVQGNSGNSRGGIMRNKLNGVENDDSQKKITKPSSGTSKNRVPRTDTIAVKGDSAFSCDSLSSSPTRSFRRIQSEIYVAGIADDASKDKDKPKPSGGTFEYRTPRTDTVAVSGDSVIPCNSTSSSPRFCKQIRSECHVASRGDEYSKYKEKTKPSGGTSKYRPPGTDISTASRDSVFPCDSLSSSPKRSFRHIRSEIHVAGMADDTSKNKESKKEDSSQEQIMTSHEVTQPGSSLAQYPCLGQTSTYTAVDSSDHSMSKYSGGNLVEKPNGDPVKKLADVTFDVGSREKYSLTRAKADTFDGEALSSDGKFSGTGIPGDLGVRLSRAHTHTDVTFPLTHAKNHVVSVPHRDSQSKKSLSSRCEIEKRKNLSNYSTQKSYPRSLPLVSESKKDPNPSTHITKRHTWHRKSDTSASPFVAAKPLFSTLSTQEKFPKVTAQSSGSYVRKGNSLLRKPSHASPSVPPGMPPSVIQLNRQLNHLTVEDTSTGAASRVDVDNASFPGKTGETISREKQSKPPSDSSTSKVSNAIATSSGKTALSYSMDHPTTGLPESIMDSATSGEANVSYSGGDTFKTYDTFIQTGYASDCQQKEILPKLDSSNLKRMVYVKRKANQLVAASDTHGVSKSQIPPSDGYFKRSKNQLVRNSDGRLSQSVSVPDNALDSRAAANMVSERSSSSAYSDSAVMRPYKHSKCSLVWTQNGPQSRRPIGHMRYQRILPQLVPWKRVTYWRRLMNSVSALKNGSFSNISRKLSMMRKRHTVYTRSTNGYSLRKSKVLSIGGSHLKWSKSIERDSRKANEEATLAVAAIAKKDSENHFGQSNIRMTSGNHVARERVFRVGGLRYKMDSSRRTLQRISDVDSPCSGASENGKGVKRAFIPKRLVIGNEEYVRVGNGNQLVRDPKKRTRVLANEKVRWSLHNVRLRLAKKKKFCQFFTRFGKCNKDDGKCPYVHDPSKIAVCTKFLNGLCANTNCKLTHKVIPERMPDCSYFLQGLCNNEACPYRHVHVNPSAAICDGFLKGYCSDGDECRKKHSYTCPVFEATGSCSQGSKCKLHHPKNQSNGRKRKRPSESSQKNARGRYFGSPHKVLSESEPMVGDRHSTESEVFGMEGLNFIFLGATEYESSDNIDSTTKQSSSGESEEALSIHNLIRPVALMH